MWHKSKQWTLAKENANLRSKNWNRTSGGRIKFSLSLSFSGSTSDIHSAASPNWDPERFDLFLARNWGSPQVSSVTELIGRHHLGFCRLMLEAQFGHSQKASLGRLATNMSQLGSSCQSATRDAWSQLATCQFRWVLCSRMGPGLESSAPLLSQTKKKKLVRIFKCLSRTCGPDFARGIPKCTQSSWWNILTSEPRKPTCEQRVLLPCQYHVHVEMSSLSWPSQCQQLFNPSNLLRRVPPQVARSQISTFRNTAAPWTVWRWGPRSGQMVGPAPKCAATKQLGSPVSTASVASEHVINTAGWRYKDHAPVDVQTDGTQRFCSNHSYLWICWN